ncbi:hypothetical protein GZH53_04535, partial [Flavihumibacter sp. R14]|nr:hypothetical protein [Flavihumibacter soli]
MKILLHSKLFRFIAAITGILVLAFTPGNALSQCFTYPPSGNTSPFYASCSDGSGITFNINAKSNIDAPATGPNYGSCSASQKSVRVNSQWILFKATDNGNVDLSGNINTGNLYLWVWGGFDVMPTNCTDLQSLVHCGQYDHGFTASTFPVVKDKWYVMLASGFKGSDSYFSLSGSGPIAIPPPVIPNKARCGAGPVTFTASGALTGQLYRWYDSNGTLVQSSTSSTYTTPVLNASATYSVEIQVLGANGTNCESVRTPVTATINDLPKIISEPATTLVCEGETASFTVGATGAGLTYQWQVFSLFTGFTNLSNGAKYSGTNTPTLSVSGITPSILPTIYRVIVGGTCSPSATSNPALLWVIPSPNSYTVTGGGNYCADGTGKPIGLSDSQIGVRYQLQKNGINSGNPVDGTGSALDFGIKTDGIYTVIATNTATGCPAPMTGSRTITRLLPITATVVVNPHTCAGPGSIQVQNVTGGLAPYSYSIDGVTFQSTNVFPVANPGSYNIIVKDAAGCLFTETRVVTALDPPIDLNFTATQVTCPGLTSDVTLSPVKGIGPFTYQITAPATHTTAVPSVSTFQGLPSGTYTFRVTDSRGCSYQENYTINPITPIDVVGQLVANVTCFDAADGKIQYTVSGFSNTYSYTVDFLSQATGVTTTSTAITGQTSPAISISGAAGTYKINVRDEVTNCTKSYQVTVQRPAAPLTLTGTVRPLTCFSDPSGSVTAIPSGGWGSNQYHLQLPDGTLTPKQGGVQFTGLLASGSYILFVTDGNGCQVPFPFSLSVPPPPIVSLDAASDLCFDSNLAKLVINASGGLAPYTYSINGASPVNSNIFANLIPGDYTITVMGANGCQTQITQTIRPELIANASLIKNLNCTASPEAAINVGITGGYAPYSYEARYNGGAYGSPVTFTGTSFSYAAPTAGTYQFRITDAKGCSDESNIITVVAAVPPVITQVSEIQKILCAGEASAAIRVITTPATGLSPFTYTLTDGITSISQSSSTFSGLKAGNYKVIVTDANGCKDSTTIPLVEPSVISAAAIPTPITCATDGSGRILGNIQIDNSSAGGKAPYSYYIYGTSGQLKGSKLATADLTFTQDSLDFGGYYAIIVDANGCSQRINNIQITTVNDLTIDISPLTADCANGASVKVSVPAGMGVGPFKFRIFPNGAFLSPDTNNPRAHTFTGLTPDVTYSFEVLDESTGCTFNKEATPLPTFSNLAIATTAAASCGVDNGNVSFTFSNWEASTSSIRYSIYPEGADPSNPLDLPVLTNTIAVTAADSLTISAAGPLAPGAYFVLLTEISGASLGCSKTADFTIVQSPSPLELTAGTVNSTCSTKGTITATARYGTAPYTYSYAVSGSAQPTTWNSLNVFNDFAGSYDVYVKDAYGCIEKATVTISQDPTPVLAALTVDNQCDVTEGNFEMSVALATPGVGPHSYSINGGAFVAHPGAFVYSGLSSGDYTVSVRDANGCTNTSTIKIYPPTYLTPIVKLQPTCADNDGKVLVEVTGGSGNYKYDLIKITVDETTNVTTRTSVSPGGVPQSSNVFSGLAAGEYRALVIDVMSPFCVEEQGVELELPSEVSFQYFPYNVSCPAGGDGSIVVVMDPSVADSETQPGGVNNNPPFIYTLTNTLTNASVSQSTPVFAGLPAGSYKIRVTSERNCYKETDADIIITAPDPITLTATATDFECDVDNSIKTSTITITAGGGTAPLLYSIDNVNFQSSNLFTVIDNGSVQAFNIFVRDANGCSIAPTPISISPLPKITAVNFNKLSAINCLNNKETVEVTVTGGSGDYKFELLGTTTSLSPGANIDSASFDLADPGSYTFRITDNVTGCYFISLPYTVAPYRLLEAVASVQSNVTCNGGSDGTLSILVSGYTGNFDYEILNSAGLKVLEGSENTSTSPLLVSGLAAGNYTVLITETDAPFCSIVSNSVTVTQPDSISLASAAVTEPVVCFGGNASVVLVADGGTAPLSYKLEKLPVAAGSLTFTNSDGNFTNLVPAGSYAYTITDVNNCTPVTGIFDIAQPDKLELSFQKTEDVSCFGGQDGLAELRITGGTAPYNYVWTKDGVVISAPQLNALSAGTYKVVIKDAGDCGPVEAEVVITEPAAVVPSLTIDPILCYGGTTTATVTAIGGVGSYTYTFNGVVNTTGIFDNIPAGTYFYSADDGNSCGAVYGSITIEQPIWNITKALVTSNYNGAQLSCPTATDGEITVEANVTVPDGTTRNVAYSIDGQPYVASGIFNNLGAGNHVISLKDEQGCLQAFSVYVYPPAEIIATASVTSAAACAGSNSGEITVAASGGTGELTYSLGTAVYTHALGSQVFTGLAAGKYIVKVTDVNGCEVSADEVEVIMNPLPLVTASASHTTVCAGTPVTLSGGGADTYTWDNGVIDGTPFIPVSTTTYIVTGIDANGCSNTASVTVVVNPLPTVTATASATTICAGTPVTLTGGGAATYTWNNGVTDGVSFIPTATTSYTVTGTDASGCANTATITVTVNPCPPVATDDQFAGTEGALITGTVAANDSDPKGHALTFVELTQPANGTLTFNSDGTFTFLPDTDWNGITTFEYQACDPAGLCDNATVTLTVTPVNDAPVALNDAYTTTEETPITIAAPGILVND